MAALRPIIREPRSSYDRSEGARLAIHAAMTPRGADAHPGILFTTDSAGMKIKPGLKGGFFNPVSKGKFI